MPAGTISRVRRRQLNYKAHLNIFRESEIDETQNEPELDADGVPQVQALKTGVDEVEEREHHLQAVIKASAAAAKGITGGKIAQTFIPVPPSGQKSNVNYNTLYRSGAFAQPATYIRFSSTVEDCIGTAYCMDEEDEAFLTKINDAAEQETAGARAGKRCSEDQFEAVMNAYEETSQTRQPFASVDDTPVLPFEEMVAAFDDFENNDLDEVARAFAEEIYTYWKKRKTEKGSKSLMPKLKTLNMDQPTKDADDGDAYVCFRRREVKQMRRTRGRDSQVVDRLKKLRRELEDGRQLLHWVKTREELRKEDMKTSRHLFEQRAAVRDLKRNLSIMDDDEELLINQPKAKRRAPENVQPNARQVPQMVRRQDSLMSLPDFDIMHYRDKLKSREDAIASQIEARLKEYERWNINFVDRTQEVLEGSWLPEDDLEQPKSQWVSIRSKSEQREPQQQPTPPESVVDGDPMDADKPVEDGEQDEESERDDVRIRWATPPDTDDSEDREVRTLYRQRRGRGGLMLDQRRTRGRPRKAALTKAEELAKYDCDSGEDEDNVDRLDPRDPKFFRLRQHLRNFEQRQRQAAAQSGGYHSRTASLATNGSSRQSMSGH